MPTQTSFLNESEIQDLGLQSVGRDPKISRFARIYSPDHISLGDNVRIDDFCVLSGGSGISIGSHVHIGCYSSVFGSGGVAILDFANISSRVAIYSESDDASGQTLTNPTVPQKWKTKQVIARVEIGKHCIVFTNSTILPGVTLEQGAVLAAHSMASHTLPQWQIHAGVPAVFLRTRSKNLLEMESRFLEEYRT